MLEVDVALARGPYGVEVSFGVAAGQGLGIFGRSGAGKTSVLESVAGFVVPQRGSVSLAGRTLTSVGGPGRQVLVAPWDRDVGLVRQGPDLFPHLSVRENVGYSPRASRAAVGRAMELVGVSALASRRVRELSGGQAQRVAIARLLASTPRTILLDEPLVGLDERARRGLLDVIEEVRKEVPAVMVAHEFGDLARFGDQVAIMDSGRILQLGTPRELYLRPKTREVASLLGFRELQTGGRFLAYLPDEVVLGASPTRGLVCGGTVESIVQLGRVDEVILRCSQGVIEAQFVADGLRVGEELAVTIPVTRAYTEEGLLMGRYSGG